MSTYLQTLIEKYQMIERVGPVFSSEKGRKTRYRIRDNFLNSWLSSLARNVNLARIRPQDEAIGKADESLMVNEGYSFEKFVKMAVQECSRKRVGDFSLTQLIQGYWNKPDGTDIEIDLVAIDEDNKIIRLGSCKRSERRHDGPSLSKFEEHIQRFYRTELARKYKQWVVQKALYAPSFNKELRTHLSSKGYVCVDMNDFEKWLL